MPVTIYDGARQLANDINVGLSFANDMLILAGGDAGIVREASRMADGAENLKAIIIDTRVSKLEEGREDGCEKAKEEDHQ